MTRRFVLLAGAVSVLLGVLLTASAESSAGENSDLLLLARRAVTDLVSHFWEGPAESGQITGTWGGYAKLPLPDKRGGFWERGMFFFVLENFYRLTGDEITLARLMAEWNRMKSVYTREEAVAVGERSKTNWAADDAGWSAMMYLAAYRITKDPEALERCKGIVENSFARWWDDELGGGMWYADADHKVRGKMAQREKSLYQVGVLYAALGVCEQTGDKKLLDRSLACYRWMEEKLLREDCLYWCGYDSSGPVGLSHPEQVHEAGSVTFFGGNMGMGVIHAVLYRITGETQYLERVLRTAKALRTGVLVNADGVLINDRDAWVNGAFAGYWAREVLALDGISRDDKEIFLKTARSIALKARTDDGYYGGSWGWPAEGEGSAWWRAGSGPQQIMTSASSANMIVAGAAVNMKKLAP